MPSGNGDWGLGIGEWGVGIGEWVWYNNAAMISNYKDLEVWQLSMDFTEAIYRLVQAFPKEERYGLSDQLRRAVVAIPSNIAEGNGRGSKKDYAHFLCIARGSLNEVNTQLEIAERLGFVTIPPELSAQSVSIAKMLNALIRALTNG